MDNEIKNKKQMSEAEIRACYIDPALEPEWKGRIRTEVRITDGAIDLSGNLVYRKQAKVADYVLYRTLAQFITTHTTSIFINLNSYHWIRLCSS